MFLDVLIDIRFVFTLYLINVADINRIYLIYLSSILFWYLTVCLLFSLIPLYRFIVVGVSHTDLSSLPPGILDALSSLQQQDYSSSQREPSGTIQKLLTGTQSKRVSASHLTQTSITNTSLNKPIPDMFVTSTSRCKSLVGTVPTIAIAPPLNTSRSEPSIGVSPPARNLCSSQSSIIHTLHPLQSVATTSLSQVHDFTDTLTQGQTVTGLLGQCQSTLVHNPLYARMNSIPSSRDITSITVVNRTPNRPGKHQLDNIINRVINAKKQDVSASPIRQSEKNENILYLINTTTTTAKAAGQPVGIPRAIIQIPVDVMGNTPATSYVEQADVVDNRGFEQATTSYKTLIEDDGRNPSEEMSETTTSSVSSTLEFDRNGVYATDSGLVEEFVHNGSGYKVMPEINKENNESFKTCSDVSDAGLSDVTRESVTELIVDDSSMAIYSDTVHLLGSKAESSLHSRTRLPRISTPTEYLSNDLTARTSLSKDVTLGEKETRQTVEKMSTHSEPEGVVEVSDDKVRDEFSGHSKDCIQICIVSDDIAKNGPKVDKKPKASEGGTAVIRRSSIRLQK